MNKEFRELARQAGLDWHRHYNSDDESNNLEQFADFIVKDIMRVVAAHALSNDSALDVFINLKTIYESVE